MDPSSDVALLASLRTRLDELLEQVEAVAVRYGESPDSGVAADLYATERSLVTARRALDRARGGVRELER